MARHFDFRYRKAPPPPSKVALKGLSTSQAEMMSHVTASYFDLVCLKSPVGRGPPVVDIAGALSISSNTITKTTSLNLTRKEFGEHFRLHYH